MIILKNGTIVFPKRGKPPTETIAGYEQDPKDPYVYYPLFVECDQRTCVQILKPCGKFRLAHMCKVLDREVSVNFCDDCPVNKELL